MVRGTEYSFVRADETSIVEALTKKWESLSGNTVQVASPEKLFISWVTAFLVQAYASINYAGNQNIPSRAGGENLDALGELFYSKSRPQAKASSVQMKFVISEAQSTALLLPAGIRVSVKDGSIVFATENDVYIPIGESSAEVRAICQTTGTSGNGYPIGSIQTCVDPFPYYESCSNIDASDGGANVATDDEYYDLLVASEDGYSTAGACGAYKYWTKSVSTEIADVAVNTPQPGQVNIYALMRNGKPAAEEVKKAIYEACSADEVRPLTDHVVVDDPEIVDFDIAMVYYISEDATDSASNIEHAVDVAVQDYVMWQCGKIGRDINPSKLVSFMIAAGVKRVEITAPILTRLRDGRDDITPQLAQINNISIVNGGYEDE